MIGAKRSTVIGGRGLLDSDSQNDDASRRRDRSRSARAEDGARERLALATRFLESEELFTDAERFVILQKCALVASCLWAEVSLSRHT